MLPSPYANEPPAWSAIGRPAIGGQSEAAFHFFRASTVADDRCRPRLPSFIGVVPYCRSLVCVSLSLSLSLSLSSAPRRICSRVIKRGRHGRCVCVCVCVRPSVIDWLSVEWNDLDERNPAGVFPRYRLRRRTQTHTQRHAPAAWPVSSLLIGRRLWPVRRPTFAQSQPVPAISDGVVARFWAPISFRCQINEKNTLTHTAERERERERNVVRLNHLTGR